MESEPGEAGPAPPPLHAPRPDARGYADLGRPPRDSGRARATRLLQPRPTPRRRWLDVRHRPIRIAIRAGHCRGLALAAARLAPDRPELLEHPSVPRHAPSH